MEVDIDAAGEQLRIYQDQYKETSKEYDQLFKELNQTSQVQHTSDVDCFLLQRKCFVFTLVNV